MVVRQIFELDGSTGSTTRRSAEGFRKLWRGELATLDIAGAAGVGTAGWWVMSDALVRAMEALDAEWRERAEMIAHRLRMTAEEYHRQAEHQGPASTCGNNICASARSTAGVAEWSADEDGG